MEINTLDVGRFFWGFLRITTPQPVLVNFWLQKIILFLLMFQIKQNQQKKLLKRRRKEVNYLLDLNDVEICSSLCWYANFHILLIYKAEFNKKKTHFFPTKCYTYILHDLEHIIIWCIYYSDTDVIVDIHMLYVYVVHISNTLYLHLLSYCIRHKILSCLHIITATCEMCWDYSLNC